jgi:hypothetical protein
MLTIHNTRDHCPPPLGFYQLITAAFKLSISSSNAISGYRSVTGKTLKRLGIRKCAPRETREETIGAVQPFAAWRSSRLLFRLLQGSGVSDMGEGGGRITDEPLTE